MNYRLMQYIYCASRPITVSSPPPPPPPPYISPPAAVINTYSYIQYCIPRCTTYTYMYYV